MKLTGKNKILIFLMSVMLILTLTPAVSAEDQITDQDETQASEQPVEVVVEQPDEVVVDQDGEQSVEVVVEQPDEVVVDQDGEQPEEQAVEQTDKKGFEIKADQSSIFDNFCKPQTPEAGDDYVGIYVDIKGAKKQGITEADLWNKDKMEIVVYYKNKDYATSPEYADEDGSSKLFFSTKKSMPSLTKGGSVTISYMFNFDTHEAEGTQTVKVGSAFTNKTYKTKSVTPKVTVPGSEFVWTGKYIKPSVTVKVNGHKVSTYKLAYAGAKSVGKAKVTVTLKDDYTGSKKASYLILPKGTKFTSAKGAKKSAKLKWKKQGKKMSNSRISGYQIQYSMDKSFKSGNKTLKVKGYAKTSAKVKKLKSGKKYYFRIRTFKNVSGDPYYSKWSKVKKVKVK